MIYIWMTVKFNLFLRKLFSLPPTAAFLFPYIILLVLIGKPMYLMETALGQYSQLGPMNVWRCAPVMQGQSFVLHFKVKLSENADLHP